MAPMFDGMKAASPAALCRTGGFQETRRYASHIPVAAAPSEAEIRQKIEENAYAKGLAEGREQMRLEQLAVHDADMAAMAELELSLGRIDADLAAQLADRLKMGVLELCETLIAPQAVDAEALEKRALKVIDMLGDAEKRVLRLNPLDMEMIAKRVPEGISVEADGSLERGSLRLESSDGGIEDGPQVWRRAIADAMSSC